MTICYTEGFIIRNVYPDGTVKRIAYMLYGKPEQAASVDLARLTTVEEAVGRGKPGTGLGELVAQVPRTLGFKVEHRPLPTNLAHSQIEGPNTKAFCKQLAEATKVIVVPAQVNESKPGDEG